MSFFYRLRTIFASGFSPTQQPSQHPPPKAKTWMTATPATDMAVVSTAMCWTPFTTINWWVSKTFVWKASKRAYSTGEHHYREIPGKIQRELLGKSDRANASVVGQRGWASNNNPTFPRSGACIRVRRSPVRRGPCYPPSKLSPKMHSIETHHPSHPCLKRRCAGIPDWHEYLAALHSKIATTSLVRERIGLHCLVRMSMTDSEVVYGVEE